MAKTHTHFSTFSPPFRVGLLAYRHFPIMQTRGTTTGWILAALIPHRPEKSKGSAVSRASLPMPKRPPANIRGEMKTTRLWSAAEHERGAEPKANLEFRTSGPASTPSNRLFFMHARFARYN
jgi:hypothetical protein